MVRIRGNYKKIQRRKGKTTNRQMVESLPAYSGRQDVTDTKSILLKVLIVLVVIGISVALFFGAQQGLNWWDETHVEPYEFGDGGVAPVDNRSNLRDAASAITINASLQEAYITGDPYFLVTRLAEWNPEGWYRIGLGTDKTYGVNVNDSGDVVMGRVGDGGECLLIKVRFNEVIIAEDGSESLRALTNPETLYATTFDLCDPSGDSYRWQTTF